MTDRLGINCADLEGHPAFWIGRYDEMPPNREVHVAFTAPDVATVRDPDGNNVEAVCHSGSPGD